MRRLRTRFAAGFRISLVSLSHFALLRPHHRYIATARWPYRTLDARVSVMDGTILSLISRGPQLIRWQLEGLLENWQNRVLAKAGVAARVKSSTKWISAKWLFDVLLTQLLWKLRNWRLAPCPLMHFCALTLEYGWNAFDRYAGYIASVKGRGKLEYIWQVCRLYSYG